MKIICSWCGTQLGEKEPFEDQSISHAKCEECLKKTGQKVEARFASAIAKYGILLMWTSGQGF